MTKIANRAQIFVPGLSALAQRIAIALDHLRGRLSCDRIPAPNVSPCSDVGIYARRSPLFPSGRTARDRRLARIAVNGSSARARGTRWSHAYANDVQCTIYVYVGRLRHNTLARHYGKDVSSFSTAPEVASRILDRVGSILCRSTKGLLDSKGDRRLSFDLTLELPSASN